MLEECVKALPIERLLVVCVSWCNRLPGCVVRNQYCIGKTRCEACNNHDKEPLVAKDDVLPTCISCKGNAKCYLNGSDCSKDDICDMFGCWNCLLVKSLNSGSIHNILQFRWNCVLQRYLLPRLLKEGTYL
jgi:hypothetical protein